MCLIRPLVISDCDTIIDSIDHRVGISNSIDLDFSGENLTFGIRI
jgi:hypothetical protein